MWLNRNRNKYSYKRCSLHLFIKQTLSTFKYPHWIECSAIFVLLLTELCARPHIGETNQHCFLSVNNHPFLVLSIEDHRTTGFKGIINEEYLKTAKQLCANTISVTFRWSYFEKNEGQYDTTILRNIKIAADKYDLKVIIIWFASNLGGHGNSVPTFILEDTITYIPYTRSDASFATRTVGLSTDRIYCYSFDKEHTNFLLIKEQMALKALMNWIRKNDSEQTFIMIQLENEVCVHPELWRPWPPIELPQLQLSQEQDEISWHNPFHVQSCSLHIQAFGTPGNINKLTYILSDTTGNDYWSGDIKLASIHELRIGGEFIDDYCQLKIRVNKLKAEKLNISNTRITPIAERCHCTRCNSIYFDQNYTSDQQYQQDMFLNYIKSLAGVIAEIDKDFPVYLNVLINFDAKTRLGNPYHNPEKWLRSIADIDFVCPDIYFESKVPVIDSFAFGRNVIFIPEAGHSKTSNKREDLSAHSLIFHILAEYRGIGIQIYDLRSENYGLISSDDTWTESAYLLRNSYSIIKLLPEKLFYEQNNLFGFRNIEKKIFHLDETKLILESLSDPTYARGIIIYDKKMLIICAIEVEVTIDKHLFQSNDLVLERGYWLNNIFIPLGPPKLGTIKTNGNMVKIRMDIDDFSVPEVFDVNNNQYCIRITQR